MRTAKFFLAGMYVHLILSVIAPIGILYLGWGGRGWNAANGGLLILYLAAGFLISRRVSAC